ncbi:hypothetical protein [Flavobacterium sp.]|uniref:hypothetical protein n=1 Tax=Flavobacterium sp. TaxID=239 RepID=UPI003B9A78C4
MGKKFLFCLIAWLVISTAGGLFKLMHWPGATLLIGVGMLFFVGTVILGSIVLYRMYQSSIENKK